MVLPSRTRTVVAFEVGCRASPPLKLPLWMIDWVNGRIADHHLAVGGAHFAGLGFVPIDQQEILHLITPFDRLDRRHPVERSQRQTTSSG